MGKWIDLSQNFYEGMPPARLVPEMAFEMKTMREVDEEKGRPNNQRFTFESHQGTHIDSPKHMIRNGPSVADFPLDHFSGRGVVIPAHKDSPGGIDAAHLKETGSRVRSGDIVFINTDWDKKFDTIEYLDCPYLMPDAADWLIEKGAKMVGMDTITVDRLLKKEERSRAAPLDETRPVHRRLLAKGILIIENLCNLSPLIGKSFTVFAFPLKVPGADGSPARVVALVE